MPSQPVQLYQGENSSDIRIAGGDHSLHPHFYLDSGKEMHCYLECLISFSFFHTGQSWADVAWGPLQLEHILGPSHWPLCLSFLHHWLFSATLQHWLVRQTCCSCNNAQSSEQTSSLSPSGKQLWTLSGAQSQECWWGSPFPPSLSLANPNNTLIIQLIPNFTSISEVEIQSVRFQHLITPQEEFKDMWMDTFIVLLMKCSVPSSSWVFQLHSTKKELISSCFVGISNYLETRLISEGRQLLLSVKEVLHSAIQQPETVTSFLCFSWRFCSQSLYLCLFPCLIDFLRCMPLLIRFVTLCPQPPPSPTKGCT